MYFNARMCFGKHIISVFMFSECVPDVPSDVGELNWIVGIVFDTLVVSFQ